MGKKGRILVFGGVLAALLATGPAAFAQTPSSTELKVMADTVWTLLAAFLVFFMQAGFAMVEAGFTRQKNSANIVMKNLMDFGMSSIAFWAVGFGLMFGAGNAIVGPSGGVLGHETPLSPL